MQSLIVIACKLLRSIYTILKKGTVYDLIIPGFFEPPVRILRATIPENESHAFR